MDSITLPTLFEDVARSYRQREPFGERIDDEQLRLRILEESKGLPDISTRALEHAYNLETLERKPGALNAAEETSRKRAIVVLRNRIEASEKYARYRRDYRAWSTAKVTSEMWIRVMGVYSWIRVGDIVRISIVDAFPNAKHSNEVIARLARLEGNEKRSVCIFQGEISACIEFAEWFVKASGGQPPEKPAY